MDGAAIRAIAARPPVRDDGELPWVRVDKDYVFDTEDGEATLADLFRGRSQLLVYHFMFDPDCDFQASSRG
jgi:predicted dithiol-disulfide oxidoreductase (DUF899 family)